MLSCNQRILAYLNLEVECSLEKAKSGNLSSLTPEELVTLIYLF